MMLQWTCHVCGRLRDDADIAVQVTDRSSEHGLPLGGLMENVRYCVDRPACREGARTTRFLRPRDDRGVAA